MALLTFLRWAYKDGEEVSNGARAYAAPAPMVAALQKQAEDHPRVNSDSRVGDRSLVRLSTVLAAALAIPAALFAQQPAGYDQSGSPHRPHSEACRFPWFSRGVLYLRISSIVVMRAPTNPRTSSTSSERT